jgi:Fe-S oxidoreductase
MTVGRSLFEQIERTRPHIVACDSETCRRHIEQAMSVASRHPVELLAAAIFGGAPVGREAGR